MLKPATIARLHTRTAPLALAIAIAVAVTGCASDAAISGNTAVIPAADYGDAFNATIAALREQRYQVDRQDYRFGVITTRPRSSPTIVEVWDPANTTAYQAFESTFNDQRRYVRVTLEPVGDAAGPSPDAPGDLPVEPAAAPPPNAAEQYELRIEAIIERYQNPLRHLTGSTHGHRVIGSFSTMPDELRQRGIMAPYWQAVGRDPYLEQRLLNRIVARVNAAEPQEQP